MLSKNNQTVIKNIRKILNSEISYKKGNLFHLVTENFDLHLPIGAGRINFKPIFQKLREIGYIGNIVLEIFNPDEEYRKISIDKARRLV